MGAQVEDSLGLNFERNQEGWFNGQRLKIVVAKTAQNVTAFEEAVDRIRGSVKEAEAALYGAKAFG